MPSSLEILQAAIQAARAGRRVEARDLLLEVVELEPHNEIAWMWLTGLVDSLEDRIIACENVLTINRANEKLRAYLAELERQQAEFQKQQEVQQEALLVRQQMDAAADLLNQAKACLEKKERKTALALAVRAVEAREDYEEAWLLLGRIAPSLDRRIAALKRAYKLNPANPETIAALKEAQYLKSNPMDGAARLEQEGKFDEAIEFYKDLAAQAKTSRDFDAIYKQITRLEKGQHEKIQYVKPTSSLVRLTFAWPILYLSMALVQMGLNPIAHFSAVSCLGLPMVLVGSFLLSLSEIHTSHVIWQKLFAEGDGVSEVARFFAAAAGWSLVVIPHVLLFLDSLNRLRNFNIPAMPF